MIGYVLVLISLLIIILLGMQFLRPRKLKSLVNRHVIITGGSSGIGKCVAKDCASLGANVTIIARDVSKLEKAKQDVVMCCKNRESQKIQYISLDLSSSYDAVFEALQIAERDLGPAYMLVNCAGTAVCGRLEDMNANDITTLMNVNYVGTVFPIKALLPGMKARSEGIIVITSSIAGLMGLFGYSAYSASKFALRGLAESLSMECRPKGVTVTLAMPPDTDTPGFENENKTKPLETKLISEAGGLVSPETVSKKLMEDALHGKFFSFVGLESWALGVACCGASPWVDPLLLPLQVLLMGPLRLLVCGILLHFNYVIKKCMKERDSNKKSQ